MANILFNGLKHQFTITSDWYLLCSVDTKKPYSRKFKNYQKILKDALIDQGFHEPIITQIMFIWEYFVIIYRNNTLLPFQMNNDRKKAAKWPDPQPQDYQETVKVINRNRLASYAPPQVFSMSDVTEEIVKNWLEKCIFALRKNIKKSKVEYTEKAEYIQEIKYIQKNDEEEDAIANPFPHDQFLRDGIENQGLIDFKNSPKSIPNKYRSAVMPLCYKYDQDTLSPLNQGEFMAMITEGKDNTNYAVCRLIKNVYVNPLTAYFSNHIAQKMSDILSVDLDKWHKIYVKQYINTRYIKGNNSQDFDSIIIDLIGDLKSENITLLKQQGAGLINDDHQKQQVDMIITELSQEFAKQLGKLQTKQVKQWLQFYYNQLMIARLNNCVQSLSVKQKQVFDLVYVKKSDIDELNITDEQKQVIKALLKNAFNNLENALIKSINNEFSITLEKHQVEEVIEKWLKGS